jgi:hypothetical protein
MTKWERRQFFEQLVQLRALYGLRGGDDSEGAMTIAEAIAYAEHLLDSSAALDLAIGPLDAEEIEQQKTAASDQSAN